MKIEKQQSEEVNNENFDEAARLEEALHEHNEKVLISIDKYLSFSLSFKHYKTNNIYISLSQMHLTEL